MEVIKKKKETQTEVYKKIKEVAEENGFDKDNSSMLTLLLRPGSTMREKQLLKKVDELLSPLNRTYMAVVEPVLGEPELYNNAGYYYHENKPWYHVHILIQEFGLELRGLSTQWFNIVGKSSKRLFHCSHVKDSICATINYMTKWFEEKRDGYPQYHIHQHQQEEQHAELTIPYKPTEEILKQVEVKLPIWKRVFNKKSFSRVVSISWICFSLLLSSIRKLE